MSRGAKLALGCLGVCVLLCCGTVILGSIFIPRLVADIIENGVTENEAEAEEIGQNILNYQVSEDYDEVFGVDILGFTGVVLGNDQGGDDLTQAIVLFTFPEAFSGSEDQMLEQIMEQIENNPDVNIEVNLEEAGTEQLFIQGEEVEATIYEGTDEDGDQFRQIVSFFDTEEGNPTMLMIVGPVESWDDEGVDLFLASIQDRGR